ncbi:uncharacterized protein [Palaemon carinicauda]|uniref:uncharacterized protein n=1 Tax=Palaemon carinicauda TaxID=392227 RepID=UPI0035B645B4
MGVKTVIFVFVATSFLLGVHGNFSLAEWGFPSYRSIFNHFPLAPLTIVRISNEKCNAGDGRNGTCLAKLECYKKGGVNKGPCALGFGVCCLMTARENGVSFGNNTLLYKDKFGGGVDITYTIMRMSDKICQYRLDVKRLILTDVAVDGSCTADYMLINQDTKFQKVCGMTENVHCKHKNSNQDFSFSGHFIIIKTGCYKFECSNRENSPFSVFLVDFPRSVRFSFVVSKPDISVGLVSKQDLSVGLVSVQDPPVGLVSEQDLPVA